MVSNNMKKYKYFAQHMHMHSCYQPGASMEGHMYHAAKLGMKYIWFTDHDVRMGRKIYQVDEFDFEQQELFYVEESGRSQGFKLIEKKSEQHESEHFKAELTKETCFTGTQCLKFSSDSDDETWKGGGVYFWSSGKRHCSSLMAGIKLEIAAMVEQVEGSRVILDVQLSQRPPEHECAHLLYVLGSTEGLENAKHTAIIPLTPVKGWHKYSLDLSNDVLQQNALARGVGGLDNAFDTLSIIVESQKGAATAYFDDFVIHIKENFEAVRNVQKEVARDKGKLYGVTPFVGTEITGAGPHKNCFSTGVPIIPYDEPDYEVSHEDAIAWVNKHGGIFALNHPFEEYKREVLSDGEKEDRLMRMAEAFIQHKAWGATMMEVGFPMGRENFSLQLYLRLWDKLTEAGIFLTGYGSSDNHSNRTDWYDGNNFATWLGVEESEAEPVSEDAFVKAMKSGRAYMGNPVVLKGDIIFETEEGLPMGSVLTVENAEQCQNIYFGCSQTKKGWKFRLVYNGQAVIEEEINSPDYKFRYIMQPQKKVNFVRAELYDENGVCIMLTNPIHVLRRNLDNTVISGGEML